MAACRRGVYLGRHTALQLRPILPDARGVRMRHASGFVRMLAAPLLILTTPGLAQQSETPRAVHRPEVPGQETAPPESMNRGLRDRAELEAVLDGGTEAN